MQHRPNFDTFRSLAQDGRLVPVYRRMLSDTLTPVTAFHRIDDGGTACLFESVVGGERVGRYSFLAATPFLQVTARGEEVTIRHETATRGAGSQRSGPPFSSTERLTSANPLDEVRQRLSTLRAVHLPELPPFCGGAVGYMGYDVVRYVENLPSPPPDDRNLPDLSLAFYDRMIIFDNIYKCLMVVAMARLDRFADPRQAYDDAVDRVDEWVDRLSTPRGGLVPVDTWDDGDPEQELSVRSNFEQSEFEKAVRRCVEYIQAGDIFQVVLSQRMEVPITAPPLEIYRTLRVVNPSPFMFFLRTPEVTLVGSSPEILCRVVDREVTVRPLAGTRPRGRDAAEDQRLAEELLTDPKERAEHVMLVDLGRNDVGRVAEFGSVQLSDVMSIERYSHVMHITSNVTGRLAEGRDAFDALQASLPAGTVSGAPKVRAMEIIDELEPHRRGPYAGAVGYWDYSGNMDTCIALRTMVVQGHKAYVQAGAGIVADSVPSQEYQETQNKARGLLKAIAMTERRRREQRPAAAPTATP